jgi:hypothetical protein
MDNTQIPRNYNMTDGDLCMFASNLVRSMTYDLTELSQFGVTTEKIAAFKALCDDFKTFFKDNYYLGIIEAETQKKNIKMKEVFNTIKYMAARVKLKFGENSVEYRSLNVLKKYYFKENELICKARSMVEVLTNLLPQLTDVGLTQNMLDNFSNLNTELENARNIWLSKLFLRNKMTIERINKGNELYNWIVKYCAIGKVAFSDKDPTSYKCYLIYKSKSAKSI